MNLKKARNNLVIVNKRNDAEFDFDEAKSRNITLSKWAEDCSKAFSSRDATLLIHLNAAFGSRALVQITEKEIIDYRAKREAQLVVKRGRETKIKTSPTTVNKECALLRKLLRLASVKGMVKRVPQFTMAAEPS